MTFLNDRLSRGKQVLTGSISVADHFRTPGLEDFSEPDLVNLLPIDAWVNIIIMIFKDNYL